MRVFFKKLITSGNVSLCRFSDYKQYTRLPRIDAILRGNTIANRRHSSISRYVSACQTQSPSSCSVCIDAHRQKRARADDDKTTSVVLRVTTRPCFCPQECGMRWVDFAVDFAVHFFLTLAFCSAVSGARCDQSFRWNRRSQTAADTYTAPVPGAPKL